MEYVDLNSAPYYADCAPLVEGMGYSLVELRVCPQGATKKISAVIAPKDPAAGIGVDDCAKVHHALLPRLEALLGTEDTFMELTSPGMERVIKNAAEFALFAGRAVRVWDKDAGGWVCGTIASSDRNAVVLEQDGTQVSVPYERMAKAKFIHL
ncbi:MAG: ribosome maturation factor RimP [Treponemataceae bacterium]|nr:ribosome maturation factor RimP [Treponemataceae bacterium]